MTVAVSKKKKSCKDLSRENKRAADELVRLLTIVRPEDKRDVATTDKSVAPKG